jgi:bacterioferritin-associated ferredoxin
MPDRQTLVVLDDGLLLNLTSRPDIMAAFSFIAQVKTAAATGSKCGACARKAASRGNVFSAVKQTIAELPDSEKLRLKNLLNTERLRLRYSRRQDGRMVELTF